MNTVAVDLKKESGEKIKPLHGVCCAPYELTWGGNQQKIRKYFEEGGIPFCRLHDCGYPWGWGELVDVSVVFPDFSADENDPESYNFHYSDEYIGAIENSGCRTYYRLGETIEWSSKKVRTILPADFNKWARICEHIIRHYNEGWANGFRYGIEYWEIWNEPENPGNQSGKCMWQGTKEDFFRLYETATKHLRSCFPEIKLGGYGSCGFYEVTSNSIPESYREFIPFFKDFLKMVKETGSPLDFFSWHIYSMDVEKLLAHARFVRDTLDEFGFDKTESHLNEWNINTEGSGFADKHTEVGAAFNAAVLAAMQTTGLVDKAMYYCFSISSRYNGFLDPYEGRTEVSWYPFAAFNKLYRLETALDIEQSGELHAVAAAAKDGRAAILISDYEAEDGGLDLKLKGIDGKRRITVNLIDKDSKLVPVLTMKAENELELEFAMKKNSVLLVEVE